MSSWFADVEPDSVFDGELVALTRCEGRPVQDFAAVTRAVLTGDVSSAAKLRFVAFDVLRIGGADLRMHTWQVRDAYLRRALLATERVRLITSQPASVEAHRAIVALGFEGTVLKRPNSVYRAGRQSAWVKHKARLAAHGRLLGVRQDRQGKWHGTCDVDGRRVSVLAGSRDEELIGGSIQLTFSRVDADGGLREARIAALSASG